jgi:hypothetical protein
VYTLTYLGIGSIQPRPYVEYIQIFIFANQLQLDREYFLKIFFFFSKRTENFKSNLPANRESDH